MDWPRVQIPGDAGVLKHSASLGEAISLLLNPETPAPRVSTGSLRLGLRVMGLPAKHGGAALNAAADLAMTAGWGSTQKAGGGAIVMPGRGLIHERESMRGCRRAD